MAQNTQPIFPLTPNVGSVKMGTTSAQVKSDGTSAGSGTDLMYCVLVTGANGSFINNIQFRAVASAVATNSVATVVRAYVSTVVTSQGVAAGATTSSNTTCIGEVALPILSASNSTTAPSYFDMPINRPFQTGLYIMVSQHIAQTTNQSLQATCYAGDY